MLTRELNELEYLSLAVGQPFNVTFMMKFNGYIGRKLLEKLLKKLQKRHPLLQVKIIFDKKGKPWFTSENVGEIPIKIMKRKNDSQAINEFHKQLTTPFDLSHKTKPLFRATLITSQEKSAIVFSALHAISDGFSMVYLVKDLLKYWINPDMTVVSIDFPTKDLDLFTPKVRRMIPKTPIYASLFYAAMRTYYFLRYVFTRKRKPAKINVKPEDLAIYSTKLSKSHTSKFLKKCKDENISVHSAVSTAFVPEHPILVSPVNLRNRLKYKVKEAFGFYTGLAVYKHKYRKRKTFWQNASKVQRSLLKNLRDRKLFLIQKIFSKTISVDFLRKVGTYYVEIATKKEPFALDNLGLLDDYIEDIDLSKIPEIESFNGGITSFLDTSIILFYTLRGEMHFIYQFVKTKFKKEKMKKYAKKVLERIISSINE